MLTADRVMAYPKPANVPLRGGEPGKRNASTEDGSARLGSFGLLPSSPRTIEHCCGASEPTARLTLP